MVILVSFSWQSFVWENGVRRSQKIVMNISSLYLCYQGALLPSFVTLLANKSDINPGKVKQYTLWK
jgi:hypothetical protein